MLSFKELSEKKKTNILINPKKKDLQEKNHGEDCDCMKCEEKRRKEDVNDGPDIATEESCGKGMYYCNTDKKCKPIPEGYKEDKDGMLVKEAKYEAGASNYGKMSIRNKRAVGYGGNAAPPEERAKAHAERMKKHKKEDVEVYWSSKALDQLEDLKEKDTALDIVKKKIIAKYGKGAIMRKGSNQPKKVKGAKSTAGTNKYKDMADQKKQTAADAKKRGFKDVKSYVNTMARYGGKDNYDKGKGLGT